jgi:lambda repressor-like predicted transcriptional regulator
MTAIQDINKIGSVLEAARFLQAFVECNRQAQENVLEMVAIITDASSTDDERTLASEAIVEALGPMLTADVHESYATLIKDDNASAILQDIQAEEEHFADKVRVCMADKGITQEMLAQKAGIGQPAVSNILNRRCRPQRRTVMKFAQSLGVSPQDLWPGFDATTASN